MGDLFSYPDRFCIVAGLITDSQNRLLLVRKRGTDAFMQPGGKTELGESEIETLGREIFEELGCRIDEASARYEGRFIETAANEPGFDVDAAIYRVQLIGVPKPRAEIAELVWIRPDNPDRLRLAPLTERYVLPLV